MVIDKSLFYYGKIYHMLLDPLSQGAKNSIVNLIPENSKVFDAGCGTGALSLLLKERKNCRVVGADLSLRMIDFAQKSNPYDDVIFLHMDIGNVTGYEENSFDYSIMCQVIHELPADQQIKVINELMRVGRETIILDFNSPLPKNTGGLSIRMIDGTLGRNHYGNFKSYITSGGIIGILERAGLKSKLIESSILKGNCMQVVVLAQ